MGEANIWTEGVLLAPTAGAFSSQCFHRHRLSMQVPGPTMILLPRAPGLLHTSAQGPERTLSAGAVVFPAALLPRGGKNKEARGPSEA